MAEVTPESPLLVKSVENFYPSSWTPMPVGKEVELVDLDSMKGEGKAVLKLVNKRFHTSVTFSISRDGAGPSTAKKILSCPLMFPTPQRIVRVQNPYLWGCYLLKKLECRSRYPATKEERLFHMTHTRNIESIVSDNLNWRKTVHVDKQSGKSNCYGKGINFSMCSYYTLVSSNRYTGVERAMIVSRILVGNSCLGKPDSVLPPAGFDSTSDIRKGNLVRYYDHEFYPEYVLFFSGAKMEM